MSSGLDTPSQGDLHQMPIARLPHPYTFFLYGPPGSGKTTLGLALARHLNLPFYDLDEQIQIQSGMSIPEIFALEGEDGFRKREQAALKAVLAQPHGVFALGGGALLNPDNRALIESLGPVLCLDAPLETLLHRLKSNQTSRPLLQGDREPRLGRLLRGRAEHYASFPLRLDATQPLETLMRQAQIRLGTFRVLGMGSAYDVRLAEGLLERAGEMLSLRHLQGPLMVVSDEHVAPHYLRPVCAALERAGYAVSSLVIPAGEQHKNIQVVASLWEAFISAGLERGSTVVALGGGVLADLVGFASATYLRGINWVSLPTTLLAMVDASLGGKTAIDLPQGKNLVGAFHPPRLVLSDPLTLNTLPLAEQRAGMAEVVKAGIIGDITLFNLCAQGWEVVQQRWHEIISRAIAVKIAVIEQDPYEKGWRAVLNLGHTIGHAVELASGFRLRHGEAVAIGLVVEARLAHHLGLAQAQVADEIEATLQGLGLPTAFPHNLDWPTFWSALQVDKKRAAGQVRFALPLKLGEVQVGVGVSDLEALLHKTL